VADVTQDTIDKAFTRRISGLESREDTLGAQSTDLLKQQQQISGDQEKLIRERGEETKAPREALSQAVTHPPETTVKEEKIPDYQRPTMSPKELHDTFGAMMVASLIVGVAARSPFMNTMTAMTGMMKGFAQADDKLVDQSLKIYDKNLAAIKARNEQYRREADDAWKKYSTNVGALKTQLELVAAKYDDPLALQAARSKSLSDAQKLIDANIRSIENAIAKMEGTRASIANAQAARAQSEERLNVSRERLLLAQQNAAKKDEDRDAKLLRLSFKDEQSLRKEYDKDTGELKKDLVAIERILQYANSQTPFADLQMRQAMTQFQKGARGTNAMIASMLNFGALDERIAGHFERFFSGQYEPEQRGEIQQLFTDLRDKLVKPALTMQEEKFRKLAQANHLNAEHVILPDPGIPAAPDKPTVPVKITPRGQ
jgi:hypothetical protein